MNFAHLEADITGILTLQTEVGHQQTGMESHVPHRNTHLLSLQILN
jgi:hypothetical protein